MCCLFAGAAALFTLTVTVTDLPPFRTVMVAVPVPRPTTAPSASTLATPGALLL